jgi:hypothetical protein
MLSRTKLSKKLLSKLGMHATSLALDLYSLSAYLIGDCSTATAKLTCCVRGSLTREWASTLGTVVKLVTTAKTHVNYWITQIKTTHISMHLQEVITCSISACCTVVWLLFAMHSSMLAADSYKTENGWRMYLCSNHFPPNGWLSFRWNMSWSISWSRSCCIIT